MSGTQQYCFNQNSERTPRVKARRSVERGSVERRSVERGSVEIGLFKLYAQIYKLEARTNYGSTERLERNKTTSYAAIANKRLSLCQRQALQLTVHAIQ